MEATARPYEVPVPVKGSDGPCGDVDPPQGSGARFDLLSFTRGSLIGRRPRGRGVRAGPSRLRAPLPGLNLPCPSPTYVNPRSLRWENQPGSPRGLGARTAQSDDVRPRMFAPGGCLAVRSRNHLVVPAAMPRDLGVWCTGTTISEASPSRDHLMA